MNYFDRHEREQYATYDDAMREHARNVGRERPDVEWILTPYDVWKKNPFYKGVPGPHPDDPPEDWLSGDENHSHP